MKKIMKTCYKCGSNVSKTKCIKDGISLNCTKCKKCGEEYFTSNELIKYDILTGKRKMIRKFGVLGDSTIVRLPTKLIKDFKIKPGDYGVFEEKQGGIMIKLVHAKELKNIRI